MTVSFKCLVFYLFHSDFQDNSTPLVRWTSGGGLNARPKPSAERFRCGIFSTGYTV